MDDERYLRQALSLAERGVGWTSPNPLVGAVIVKDGRVIGEGWHVRCGELHAERHALTRCTEDPRGATMYVNLEPCCHQGRQPPCVDAIIEAGIARVVLGARDPNPSVAGQGIARIRRAGIQVTEGCLAEECRQINEVFFHYIQTKRPFLAMKYAMTQDGKIAAYTGASQWISGEESRRHAHALRNRYRGILVGVGTVLADDPMLNCRMEGGRDPIRILCDSQLRTPLTAQVVRTAREIPTILATCCTEEARQAPYREAGCTVIVTPPRDGSVDLSLLMQELGQREIDSVLLEGGGTLNWSALQQGLVQKVYTYIAPKLLGGAGAKSPVEGQGFPRPDEAVHLRTRKVTMLGEDLLIESEVCSDVYGNC